MHFLKNTLTATLILSASIVMAAPQESRVPGGIAIFSLPGNLPANTRIRFQDQPVFIETLPSGERRAIVGIPLSASVGEAKAEITGSSPLVFQVLSKNYAEQHITLPTNKHVTPVKEDLERYEREAKEQQAVYLHYSEGVTSWPTFIKPVTGTTNDSFGKKRFFNGEPRAPHAGLDIPAKEGTPIKSPADGVVVQTGDYFFNGRTVMIDHGQGLISMLCHMSKIKAKTGDKIKAGDVIGLVGATGRATGPHVHWTVSLNNARIDPALLLP